MFGVDDAVSAVAGIGGKLIDRLWPDPTEAAKAKLELMKMQQAGELQQMATEAGLMQGQIDINKIEAGSDNLFVSGARPFIMWVCGISFAWNFVGLSIVKTIFAAFHNPIQLSPADLAELTPVLFALLGLGGMRSYEKTKGVA